MRPDCSAKTVEARFDLSSLVTLIVGRYDSGGCELCNGYALSHLTLRPDGYDSMTVATEKWIGPSGGMALPLWGKSVKCCTGGGYISVA